MVLTDLVKMGQLKQWAAASKNATIRRSLQRSFQGFIPMDVMLEPEVGNQFPDCVAMKLHLKANAAISKASSLLELGKAKTATHPKEIDLSLTLNFSGEQEIEVPGGNRLGLPGGRATFGVKRGRLRFVLQNCALPLEKVALSKPFKVSIEIEKQTSKSNELQAAITADTRSIGAKASEGSTEKTTMEVFQVKKIGSEHNPSWVFEAYDDRLILEGTLAEQLLGTLCIANLPCELTADFAVRGDDVRLTWGQIGQVQNINRNKLAIIERAIAMWYIKPMVEAAPLCQARWQHG